MKNFKSIIISVLGIGISILSFNIVQAAENKVVLKIDDPIMTVNGEAKEIDPGAGTAPIISNGRTLVPIRAIIESLGGSVKWNAETSTASVVHGENNIELTLGSKTAYINGEEKVLDTEPVFVNGRTMLPLRFISEGFGFDIDWNNEIKSITIVQSDADNDYTANTIANDSGNSSNTLVVYFTRADNIEITDDVDAVSSASLNIIDGNLTGNTQIAANYIHEKVGGDIINIEAENYYPSDYNDHTAFASNESDENARPAIKTHIDDFDKYDTVYLCYPIWWGTMPMPVYTFIETHNFDGKTVIPVSTSGGSGLGSTQKDIEKLLPDAKVVKGFTISGSSAVNSQSSINKAIDELKLQ